MHFHIIDILEGCAIRLKTDSTSVMVDFPISGDDMRDLIMLAFRKGVPARIENVTVERTKDGVRVQTRHGDWLDIPWQQVAGEIV